MNQSAGIKARILLKADVSENGPGWSDERIAEALETSLSTVLRTRRLLVDEGLEAALSRKKSSWSPPRTFDGEAEAELIALACTKPPQGYTHWTLRLLEKRVVELGIVEAASDTTIYRVLKENELKPHKNPTSRLNCNTWPLPQWGRSSNGDGYSGARSSCRAIAPDESPFFIKVLIRIHSSQVK